MKYLPNVNPIGRHFGLDDEKPADIEIVGVMKDAQFHDARERGFPDGVRELLPEPESVHARWRDWSCARPAIRRR